MESSFDLSNEPPAKRRADSTSADNRSARPISFLGIHFDCCQTYRQIYRNLAGTAYVGKCPKCGARIRVPIGSGGSSGRFYSAG